MQHKHSKSVFFFLQCNHCTGRDLRLSELVLPEWRRLVLINFTKMDRLEKGEGGRDWQRLQHVAPRWELGDGARHLGSRPDLCVLAWEVVALQRVQQGHWDKSVDLWDASSSQEKLKIGMQRRPSWCTNVSFETFDAFKYTDGQLWQGFY